MRLRFCPIVALLGLLLFSGSSDASCADARTCETQVCLARIGRSARLLHRRLRQGHAMRPIRWPRQLRWAIAP